MKIKTIFFLLLFLAFGFLSNSSADASVEASPFRIEETVEPGERVTSFINVTNASDKPQTFYTFVKDFVPRGERGGVRLVPAGSEEGPFLSSWVDIPREGMSFAPRERRQVQVNFRVPQNVGPGGYYGAVVFGPKAPEIEEGEGSIIALAHQVGVLVLFQVEGDAYHEARIREFTTDSNFYENPFTVNFTTRVENLGNVHVKPVGTIKIENMRGSQVATISVNEDGANALPQSIRRFENTWEGDFGFGQYTATLVLSFGGLTSDTGTGIRTVSAQKTFWIIPWDIVIPAGVVFLVVVLTIIITATWSKKKAVREALRQAGIEERGRRKMDRDAFLEKKKGVEKVLAEKKKKKSSVSPIYSLIGIVAVVVFVVLVGGVIFFLFFS